MKRGIIIILIVILSLSILYLELNKKENIIPNTYYQVYLNDEILGTIKSKKDLELYIDRQNNKYKKKYNVDKVYAPNGLEIKKVNTYHEKLESIPSIYKKISDKGIFTISGYQFKIRDNDKVTDVYVVEEDVFTQAVDQTINTFIGETKYALYKNNNQQKIETTGTIIENVYVSNNITVKKVNIPVTEKIYTEVSELAKFLLFGTTEVQKTYEVKPGETIEEVAFNNKISVEEFLISNTKFTSSKNLLFPGQKVVIGVTNPQIQVVVEEFAIEDVPSRYQTEERYDPNRFKGDDKVIQKGENGLDRITQRTRKINGIITYVDKIASEELKPPINQIIVRGKKEFPSVGSLTVWAWPTERGYKISSPYEYRPNPITGEREKHDGIDIAGTGYGSNVYAANNGTVVEAGYTSINGNYIIINHNNGYYTIYAHLSKILTKEGNIVARGSVIGLVGSTGRSTGPHLHFGIFVGYPYNGGDSIDPLRFY